MNKFFKNKIILSFFILFFLTIQIFGSFFNIDNVYAFVDPVNTAANVKTSIESTKNAIESTKQTVTEVKKEIKEETDNALLSAALGSLVSGASYFMRKLAYDSAKYISSGGKGQGALAFQDGFGDYLLNTAGDAASTAISDFGGAVGLNLCKPADIGALKDLQTSLNHIYNDLSYLDEIAKGVTKNSAGVSADGAAVGSSAPQASCKWSDFKKNWSAVPDMFGTDAISERFANSLDAVQSDFGLALTALSKLDRKVEDAKTAATNARLEGAGFKSVTDKISGFIKTPSSFIAKEAESLTAKEQGAQSANQLSGLYGTKTWAIIAPALSIFAGNLATDLLNKVFTKGIIPASEGNAFDYTASTLNANRKAAERVFSFLVTGLPQRNLSSYDIVTYYSSCPDNPGLNNCVIDGSLVQALERSRSGQAITIREALDSGLLHGNWQIVPSSDVVDNMDKNCYRNAYCFSNIQKMRKARILPLGFEIAARKSNPDTPWTLQQFVDGYNDCNDTFTPDLANPFCHLIDPNWLLEVPEAICETQVYGSQLAFENSGQRRQECVDFSTCLSYNSSGECKAFGYCTQEKNVWDMPGKSCPAEYATCKTYTSSDGKIGSYLSRTIDYGTCNVGSVGCTAYSTDQVDDKWKNDSQVDLELQANGREQVLYFNKTIDNYSCPDSANGCSLFIYPTTTQDVYLKKAPDYLNCYDTNLNTSSTIDWPQTKSDLTKLASVSSDKCSDFAPVCIPEEVGCEEYSPKNGGVTLTGVVGNNYCPSQCVGYETFKQEATKFEDKKYPLYFIPTDGQSCAPQYAGCDEFTNLGTGAGETLEYYSDLKYCQRPDSDNAKTFYSWEGSATQGYVLKKHELLKIDDTYLAGLNLTNFDGQIVTSSPAYIDGSQSSIAENYSYCNATNYDILVHNPYRPEAASADCRALYDDAGAVFYRLLSETVTVSNACQPLRKTNAEFYEDTALSVDICEQKGGKMDGGSCMRCMNGGTYNLAGDYCQYWSIPSEAESCPAVVNGCRLYIGNTGNNIHEVYSTSFEPGGSSSSTLVEARVGWGDGVSDPNLSVQPEATQVGLYSLRVKGGSTRLNFDTTDLQPGSWYELSFWARGDSTQLGVYFGGDPDNSVGNFTKDPLTKSAVPINIGFDWKEYKLGPVLFNPTTTTDYVIWFDKTSGGNTYFLDNIRLVSMGDNPNDYVPLIKDSWKTVEGYDVSNVCDSTPLDPYPGEYLGCRTYKDREGADVSLTGFQNLCRTEAVGCAGLVDTGNVRSQNYLGASKLIYNSLCVLSTGSVSSTCGFDADEDDVDDYICEVEKGKNSCYIIGPISLDRTLPLYNDGANAGLYIDSSTVVVPVNDNNSDLAYLSVRSEYLCSQSYLGCQEVGVQNQVLPDVEKNNPNAYEFGKKYILNNVSNYGETLCTQEQISCQQFKSGSTISFFKDPNKNGALCVYKDATQSNDVAASGWFFDDIGKCDDAENNYCKQNSDCAEGVTCSNIGQQACYPTYVDGNNEYGLWSNASDDYAGLVGVCNASYNQCTELVDPASKESYYVVADDALFANTGTCDGKVSQTEGCVLFDQTENPSKFYDSVMTYQENKDNDYQSVSPTTVTSPTGDANLLLKVDRSRQCGEWLSCRSSRVVIDKNGVPQEICSEYKACNALGTDGKCSNWVFDDFDNSRLTEGKYIASKKDFGDVDYSGLSLYNKYNISNYVYIIFPSSTDAYLAYQMSDRLFAGEYAVNGCSSSGALSENDGDACGIEGGGRCFAQKCLYPIDGIFDKQPKTIASTDTEEQKKAKIASNVADMMSKLEPVTCKNYPEADSPFDVSIALGGNAKLEKSALKNDNDNELLTNIVRYDYSSIVKKEYSNAKLCQFDDGTRGECSCDYIKVEYKDGTTDYWSRENESTMPTGICSGMANVAGKPCTEDKDCKLGDEDVSYGVCNLQKSQGTYIGFKGLCLEYDLSRPLANIDEGDRTYQKFACLTWLPIQESATSFDLYNQKLEAGYYPVSGYDSEKGGLAYCKEAQSVVGNYDGTMIPDITYKNTSERFFDCSIDNTDICGTYLFSEPKSDFTMYYDYNEGGGGFVNYGVFSIAPEDKIETYYNKDSYKKILQNTNDSSDHAKEAYRAFQTWGWRNLSTSAKLLRLDLQNDDHLKEMSIYNYNGSDSPWPNDKTSAMFSFAPVLKESNAEDAGTAVHPPRRWDDTVFSVPKSNIYNYFVDSTGDIKHIETSPYSPEFDGSSVDNKFIYVDSPVERKINEHMLDRVYFVPTIYPDGVQGLSPGILSNQFYIDFSQLRSDLDSNGDKFIITHQAFNCWKNDLSVCHGDGANADILSYVLERKKDKEPLEIRSTRYGANKNGGFNDNCSTNGLVSFCKYNNSFLPSQSSEARNQIYRRYVVLFYDQTKFIVPFRSLFVEDGSSINITPNNDPFSASVTCVKGQNNNYLAIGMDFNKDGEFLGYISRWCNSFDGGASAQGNGISFATFAQFTNFCTDVVSVVNGDSHQLDDYNKAWTDRVTKESKPFLDVPGLPIYPLVPGSEIAPYASLETYMNQVNLNVADVSDLPAYIRFYSFPNDGTSDYGTPYFCGNSFFHVTIASGISNDTVCINSPYSPDSLKLLFNKYYTEWNIPSNQKTIRDYSGTNLGNTNAPQIFAINYVTCSGSGYGDSSDCKAAKPGFTINRRNYTLDNYDDIPGADEDANRNGIVDPIIAEGSYPASAKFFAYADDNRMPIKRVMVDWGDDSNIYDKLGSIKNHKPYCAGPDVGRCTTTGSTWTAGSETNSPELTCKEDSDCKSVFGQNYICDKNETTQSHFGDASRACDDTYFEYSHTYYCNSDQSDGENKYALSEIRVNKDNMFGSIGNAEEAYSNLIGRKFGEDGATLVPTSQVCIFRPAVQVLDNWGWCNGSCNYKNVGACYYNAFVDNGYSNQCDPTEPSPYIEFKGAIVVIP